MKQWIILLLISLSFISIQTANATSGRTNSSGCHNSKKVGYHCHGAPKVSSYKSNSTTYTSKNKSTSSFSSSNKKVTDINNLVHNIQLQLNIRGYQVGKVDGILGEKTISGIKRFQVESNIVVDGKPTTGLLKKLVLANS